MKISKIILHDEPAVQEIQISNLKNFLLKTFHVDVEIKGCIFNNLDVKDGKKFLVVEFLNPKFHLKSTYQTNRKLILRKLFVKIPN